jgi:hypothetical protein
VDLGTQVGIPSHAFGFGACNTRRSSGGEGSEDGGGRKSWGEAVSAYNFESGLIEYVRILPALELERKSHKSWEARTI